jgi:hypothetical protein
MLKFVDISGYGQSGKSVISDLLREFDSFWVPHNLFEFDLIRVPGGLLDLYHALVEDWSVIRADAAVRRFRKVAYRMGEYARLSSPKSLFNSYGTNYQKVFRYRFFELTDKFVNSLIVAEFQKEWPFSDLERNNLQTFYKRAMRVIGLHKNITQNYILTNPQANFINLSTNYINRIFSLVIPYGTSNVVLHNALEPFNPVRGLSLLGDAREIVVSRDPRDIYASIFVKDGVYIPDFLHNDSLWQLKASMIAANDINIFIQQQRILSEASKSRCDDNRVLRLNYEDIVMNYDKTLKRILLFLELDSKLHHSPKKFFNPELSKANVGIWRKIKDQPNIQKIQSELNDLCWGQN